MPASRYSSTVDWVWLSRLLHVSQGLYAWVDDTSVQHALDRLLEGRDDPADLSPGEHDGDTHRAHRVATVVLRVHLQGHPLDPLTLDIVKERGRLTSHLKDGHHRLRALQFCDCAYGTRYLQGLPCLVLDPEEVLGLWPS